MRKLRSLGLISICRYNIRRDNYDDYRSHANLTDTLMEVETNGKKLINEKN